jgi:protein gp37
MRRENLMGASSQIEWLRDSEGRDGSTWNPIAAYLKELVDGVAKRGWFCTHKDELCSNCYAGGMNVFRGTGLDFIAQNLDKHRFEVIRDSTSQSDINWPLRVQHPRRIFPCSMTDIFAPWHPDKWLDEMFATMILANWHDFIITTKDEDRMVRYLAHPEREALWMNAVAERFQTHKHLFNSRMRIPCLTQREPWLPIENVLLGVSVGNQKTADKRRDYLLTMARDGWATWASYEPALAPVDWSGWEFLSWLVSGGESGQHARPSHPACHRGARDWCAANGVAYFFKQWGRFYPVGRIGDKSQPIGTTLLDEDEGAFQVTLDGRILQADARGQFPPIPPGTAEMIRILSNGRKAHNHKKAEPRLDGRCHRGYPERVARAESIQ